MSTSLPYFFFKFVSGRVNNHNLWLCPLPQRQHLHMIPRLIFRLPLPPNPPFCLHPQHFNPPNTSFWLWRKWDNHRYLNCYTDTNSLLCWEIFGYSYNCTYIRTLKYILGEYIQLNKHNLIVTVDIKVKSCVILLAYVRFELKILAVCCMDVFWKITLNEGRNLFLFYPSNVQQKNIK